jgi:hypothetical protein
MLIRPQRLLCIRKRFFRVNKSIVSGFLMQTFTESIEYFKTFQWGYLTQVVDYKCTRARQADNKTESAES